MFDYIHALDITQLNLNLFCNNMAAAAAVGEIAGIAGLIGNIYGAIGRHVTGKAALKALLNRYRYRLDRDQNYLQRGFDLGDECQDRAMDLYEEFIITAEWLASKHIRLTGAHGPANRRWWKFPWKFSDRKKLDFEYFLEQIQHAHDKLLDCIQKSPPPLVSFFRFLVKIHHGS